MRFPIFVALRHILARAKSTALILLGVGVGVFVMTVMQSMMLGFQGQFLDILLTISPGILVKARERGSIPDGRLYVAPGPRERAPALYAQTRLKPVEKEQGIRNFRVMERRIKEIPGIVAVAALVQGRAMIRYGTRERGANVIGVAAQDYDRVVEFRQKVDGNLDEFVRRRDGVIVGWLLAEEMGIARGARLRLVGTEGRGQDVRVVAFFRSGVTVIDQTYAFVNLPVGQQLLGYPASVTGMAIKVARMDRAPTLARRVEFATGYESQSWQEINANFFALLRQQNVITFGSVALVVLVAGFGIANGLITAVLEKKRDIGILKALGVTARGIAVIFVVEGVVMGLLGSLVGLAFGAWMIDAMAHMPIPGRGGLSAATHFAMLRSPAVYAASAGFAGVVSLLASLFPALRAARYDPVEIIRTAR